MAINTSKMGTKGGDNTYDTSQLRGVREETGVVEGVVKTNVDPTHNGIISVFIPAFSTDENDRNQWRQVRYSTPFYSRTDLISGEAKTPAGFFSPAPDVGTRVLCVFPHGHNSMGYYFASVPDVHMLATVPESGTNAQQQPAKEFVDDPKGPTPSNKITVSEAANARTNAAADEIQKEQLRRQGLLKDSIRGLSTSNAMRESPAELVGLSSKGRRITKDGKDFLIENAAALSDPNTTNKDVLAGLLSPRRRKGHSIVLDDGDINGNSNHVRLRTSTGHQILLNDSEGIIYIANATGSAYIEMGRSGNLDIYAADSINFRSKNINFHADENIKTHSRGYTQFVSEKQMHVEGKEGLIQVAQNGEVGLTGAKGINLSSGSGMKMSAGGSVYINGSGIMSIAGSLVLLQGPKNQAKQSKPVQQTLAQDVAVTGTGEQAQYAPSQGVQTSVDKVITHEPAVNHNTTAIPSDYSGGLQGGGMSAFAILSTAFQFASAAKSLPTGDASYFGDLGNASAGSIELQPFTGNLASGETLRNVAGKSYVVPAGFADAPFTVAGTASTAATTASSGGGFFDSISSSIGEITSSVGVEFNSLTSGIGDVVSDIGGELSSLATEVAGQTEGLVDSVQGFATQIKSDYLAVKDGISDLLAEPIVDGITVKDVVTQFDNGFTVGLLEGGDVQYLNAAVTKAVGSNQAYGYIAAGAQYVGKYGFDVEQLKSTGLVSAEAVFNDQLSDPSVWTGKDGMTSLTSFLGNAQIQEETHQALVAQTYQELVNTGGIKTTDNKEEVMAMLTGALTSNVDLATRVRAGEVDLNVTKNTTSLDASQDVASQVKKNIQLGGSAARQSGTTFKSGYWYRTGEDLGAQQGSELAPTER